MSFFIYFQVQHGSGVYVFMRTQMGEALNDCRMSIVKREHILKQAPGHLKGIAKKESVRTHLCLFLSLIHVIKIIML